MASLFFVDEILPDWYLDEDTIHSILCKNEELIFFEGDVYITRYRGQLILYHIEKLKCMTGDFFSFLNDLPVHYSLMKNRLFFSNMYRKPSHMRFVKTLIPSMGVDDIEFSLSQYKIILHQISLLKELFKVREKLSEKQLIDELEKIFI